MTLLMANKVFKRSRSFNTRSEWLKVPKIAQGAQNRRSRIRNGLSIRILTLLLNHSLTNPRRDQNSRDATTETVEGESVFLAVGRSLGVCEVIGSNSERGRDVIVETTRLVEGEDEEGLVPLGRGTEGIVDVLDEDFAVGDQARWVHRVGANAAAGWVDETEFGEGAIGGIGVEGCHGLGEAFVAAGDGPVEEPGVDH